jgi:hypothetical protein
MDAATENLPVAFAAMLAGGLLLQHGIGTAKGSFSSSSTASAATGTAGTGTTSNTGLATSAVNAVNKLSGKAFHVIASQESDGGNGSCGPIGSGGLWFSELSSNPNVGLSSLDFAGLGKLPCGAKLQITNPANGKTVIAEKRDVGAGSSFLPVMGIYPATAAALGLSGGEYHIVVQRADGGNLSPVRGTPA